MVKSIDQGRSDVPPPPSFDFFFLATRAIAEVNPDLARWENEGGACVPSGLASKPGASPPNEA